MLEAEPAEPAELAELREPASVWHRGIAMDRADAWHKMLTFKLTDG